MIMKTAICCIAKCENRYLREWVDYHLNLGFSHIYIWDNNNPDGEHPEDVLADFSQVTILDCRGEKAFQNKAYTKFYNEYGNEYDWIAYIDVDEFITFSEQSGIHEINDFLSGFDDNVKIIHLNWMCYGDNDITELTDDFSMLSRFVKPMDFDKKVQYDFPENNHVKSIIRGNMDIGDKMITVHTPKDLDCLAVDARGIACDNDYFKPYDFSVAYIRHYVTKTLPEWLIKISRGRATVHAVSELYPIERFFLYNERTANKEKIIRDFLRYKEAIEQSVATELDILRNEKSYYKKQLEHVNRDYEVVVRSKAYKIGRMLLAPLKLIKK